MRINLPNHNHGALRPWIYMRGSAPQFTRRARSLLTLIALVVLALPCISFAAVRTASLNPEDCLFLPPSLADRVVFYDGFELPAGRAEINRIGAEMPSAARTIPNGLAGSACRSNDPTKGEQSFVVRSPRLSADRPLTVMRWWRVDTQMQDVSSFQLLALLGKGHISCFVHGKGEWCALQRPTMFVQVDHFPNISNVNWAVKDNAYYAPGEWHHIAITVGNASEINFYLDGAPLVSVHIKGRLFAADDINTLQANSDTGRGPEHPTSTDELLVLDRILSAEEIAQYYTATRRLGEMGYPPLLNAERSFKSASLTAR